MKKLYTLTITNLGEYDGNLDTNETDVFVGSLNSIQNYMPDREYYDDYKFEIMDNETGEIIEHN